MSNLDRYRTRKQAQTPRKVYLMDPASGKMTEDWILVRSSLSDEFIAARDDSMQAVQEIVEPNKEKRKEQVSDIQLGLKVALVAGWSFEEPFTDENVRNWLRDAPQVQMMVMSVADDFSAFFAEPSEPSSAGRKKK
jgi:hypothetical protein